jgi:hypothetical protein
MFLQGSPAYLARSRSRVGLLESKAGKRLLKSVREKLAIEGFAKDDFSKQKDNRWRLQGKTFFDIFAEIHHENLYAATYGMMSDSTMDHGMNRWIGA